MNDEKVNGTDRIFTGPLKPAVMTPPEQQFAMYGIAFGAGPQELAQGIHNMAMNGYIVDGDIFSHVMKTGWFRKTRLMCVLMYRSNV